MSVLQSIDLSSVWAGIMTLYVGVSHLRKHLSKDKLELRGDAALLQLIDTLRDEKDKALLDLAMARQREDNAWIARNEDAKLIGRMSVQVDNLAEMNKILQSQVVSLRKDVHVLRDALAVFKGQAMMDLIKGGLDMRDPRAAEILDAVSAPIPPLVCDLEGGTCPQEDTQGRLDDV